MQQPLSTLANDNVTVTSSDGVRVSAYIPDFTIAHMTKLLDMGTGKKSSVSMTLLMFLPLCQQELLFNLTKIVTTH